MDDPHHQFRQRIDTLTAERDAARAQVEKLRAIAKKWRRLAYDRGRSMKHRRRP